MTTDKGQDALEELRRLAEMHRGVPGANPLTPPIRQTLERLAAAWEKERAGFEALMPHVDTIKELAALRVEVQAVEEDADSTQVYGDGTLAIVNPTKPRLDFPSMERFLEYLSARLRRARGGDAPASRLSPATEDPK